MSIRKIAILIPVYNNISFTQNCISQLSEMNSDTNLKNISLHLVVIDDGSVDGTGEWIVEHHPEVSLLKGSGDLWWSGGINVGASFAVSDLKADYILLWNNDVIAAKDYFLMLDEIVPELADKTIVGSKIYQEGLEDIIWSFGGIFNPKSGANFMIGSGKPETPELNTPREVDWLPGMGTLLPVSVLEDVGLWDEKTFPQYFGDSDMTLRAKECGYRNIVYPQLKLWNDKTNSGLTHEGTLRGLYLTLTDIKSCSKVSSNLKFYRRHSTSPLAYRAVTTHYFKLIGGFFKWKLLGLFGFKKHK